MLISDIYIDLPSEEIRRKSLDGRVAEWMGVEDETEGPAVNKLPSVQKRSFFVL